MMKPTFRRRLKKVLVILLILFVFCFIAVLWCNHAVDSYASGNLFNDTNQIPYNKVAVVPGASKLLANGTINPYFQYRCDAAWKLFISGKISYILLSGDHSVIGYNEPQDMKDELVSRGIPPEKIFLDYAGFRTFDSMIRAKEIFGQSKFTVVSQPFHNERALYICHHEGISAVGFDARDVSGRLGFQINVREKIARVKMFIDLYVIPAHPRFLGEKIEIK
ncbi:MAG TPA: ElyC/SanA/YdcF family protein [Chitinophagales bacterium]|nr:ElyC/SanA/YdcF family protein [Chitinophagales bacterium]